MEHVLFTKSQVSFCFKGTIVANTLDARMLKHNAQYQGFKHHNKIMYSKICATKKKY